MNAYQELETRVREKSNHPIRYRARRIATFLQSSWGMAGLSIVLRGLFR